MNRLLRDFRSGDVGTIDPALQVDVLTANLRLLPDHEALAREAGCTPAQLALSWVLTRQPGFVAVIGARTRAQLDDALGARLLSEDEAQAVEALLPQGAVAGSRYGEEQMKHLDSER